MPAQVFNVVPPLSIHVQVQVSGIPRRAAPLDGDKPPTHKPAWIVFGSTTPLHMIGDQSLVSQQGCSRWSVSWQVLKDLFANGKASCVIASSI